MRSILLQAALLSLMLPAIAQTSPRTVRIGTYNLRMQQLDQDTPDRWELRRDKCIASILDNGFDVFGVQEIAEFAQSQIVQDLDKDYDCVFFSPYSADGRGDKASGIIYRKSRFTLLEYHFFWLSETPDLPSENDHFIYKGQERSYKRGGACAVLKDRKTGKKLFFLNHHGILNKDENLRYAQVLVDIEKKYNPKGYPSFLVGDFNARLENPSHIIYRAYWKDSAQMSKVRLCTMNAFETDSGKWDNERHIDYVYYRNVADPIAYSVNQKLYGGRCASDHFPVWADFKL